MRIPLAICVAALVVLGSAKKPKPIPMPPLPTDPLPRAKGVQKIPLLTTVKAGRVVLVCQNRESPYSAFYETGLEATTNYTDWVQVGRVPYQTNIVFVLTNRPPYESYRAFNTIKL